jgi:formylglycine-generating enzyme required for sulfatase activity
MRSLSLLFLALALASRLPAAEYLLWDGHESVAEYANRVNLPPTKTLDLGNGVKMELVLIPAGKFVMGAPEPTPVDEDGFHTRIVVGQALLTASATALLAMLGVVVVIAIRKRRRPQMSLGLLLVATVVAGSALLSGLHWKRCVQSLEKAENEYQIAKARFHSAESSEKPGHPVTLTKPFYMGKFAVTQEQYQQITGWNPSNFNGKDNPVENVTWNDAEEFCKKVTEQTKQTVGLPTEAEWEYACRAGTATVYYSGDVDKDLDRVAWSRTNSKNTTHPVGQKEPNAFGLYDMHGNVWQWCKDLFGDYSVDAVTDPQGSSTVQGTRRELRGGSWDHPSLYCRSASRVRSNPLNYGNNMGFRVVVVAPSTTQ